MNWDKINQIINNKKHDMKGVLNDIQKELENYHYNRWCKCKNGNFPQLLKDKSINPIVTIKAWKRLNIKKSAFIQVVKLQENAIITGNRKSKITGNEGDKYCKYCGDKIASINHILFSCPLQKKTFRCSVSALGLFTCGYPLCSCITGVLLHLQFCII